MARFRAAAERSGFGLPIHPLFEDYHVFSRLGEATDIVRSHLADEDFLLPSVEASVARSNGEKRLQLEIQPGPKARARTLQFSGNEQISSGRLRAVLSDAGLDKTVWVAPEGAR